MEQVIMNQLSYPILSTLIFLPVFGALLLLFARRSWELLTKWVALTISIATFLLSIPLFTNFDKSTYKMQFVERFSWIPDWNINYYIGVDGISILFVLLSTLVAILCVLISWNAIKTKVKEFYIAILLTTAAMIGVFCSLDFFLFYIFWEAMLIPMFLIIGVWGGPNRIYATIKFFLYTLIGSVMMLVGIIVLYLYAGKTLDILELTTKTYPYNMQLWLFWAFFAAFAVKVPMFPVHTWLPDAHTEAPTAGSVILAAVLIKMGAYGFLRFSLPLFPDASRAMTPAMLALSVIAIIYGAVICLGQTDLKRLIAYSSVSHMGFVTLGIFALNSQGLEGGILQMLNHGVVTGALFLSVGIVYDRTHSRQIADYGGLATHMPIYAAFFMVFTLSAIGLPATNGFIGEFLIILGGFTANKWAGVLAATGVIIGAGYMLWLYQRVFFMDINKKVIGLPDMDIRETITLIPLLILVFWIGVYPNSFLSFMHASVQHLIERVNMPGGMQEVNIAKTLMEVVR
ncbi:MAG: NADH-quinone oxidoreductase subunit M [Nitrospirae bacterium CG_4_10_14_0_8_um_filter_41_23]|nr:NADH-quinone oxidoreductase subunit M [Nitrospirota bacterium]PIQ94066.1 MAG: NADH-quinone oxidoreductase subunit M [Nitrospirae bacterium CG11_big_fil_rev_8_21_14_0_20_41_14]PIV44504.1 MAG: NADH-quinone oxidoreductase subunit M [Nitrospirae bacterium CG02_land_8_20_14_3_00_41_53]PIW87103.1 MAG: NADH-quinone oxidoreductase subunit M [Nitrospirae bacterium CG_4_8_14_3_um_filter_41_47]PIY85901.1 MAG: NADH-quinone oxidoreductase subunit M [Nitrospirae bacterium CG_4_10_14_0_8_um_filter_41_23]P